MARWHRNVLSSGIQSAPCGQSCVKPSQLFEISRLTRLAELIGRVAENGGDPAGVVIRVDEYRVILPARLGPGRQTVASARRAACRNAGRKARPRSDFRRNGNERSSVLGGEFRGTCWLDNRPTSLRA